MEAARSRASGGSFDRDQIAAHRDLDAEPLLEPHEMPAVAARERGKQRVALEFQHQLLAG